MDYVWTIVGLGAIAAVLSFIPIVIVIIKDRRS